ncbi:MAG: riboflavin kinase, partial [Phycisphaerales bacterium]
FDGVHRGHAAIVARARALARERSARVIALAFDPHPASVLRPGTEPARLTTFAQRERLLKAAGADEVIRLTPEPRLLGMSPEEFVRDVLGPLRPVAVVEGPDFRFGKGRAGDLCTLAALGRAAGFDVHTVEPVEVALSDHTVAPASSTLVRWMLSHGRVTDAARLLGRAYELEGEVVRGDQRGRELGFLTANLRTECMVPADGIYAGMGALPDGRAFPAAISVGTKPTFGEHARAVEAHLILGPGRGHPGSPAPLSAGVPGYGWTLRLSFTAWLRDQARFDSAPELVDQIARDCERAAALSPPTPELLACP